MSEAEGLARRLATVAVAPMEGHAVEFGVALEMAITNVANRLGPILSEALARAREEARKEGEAGAAGMLRYAAAQWNEPRVMTRERMIVAKELERLAHVLDNCALAHPDGGEGGGR